MDDRTAADEDSGNRGTTSSGHFGGSSRWQKAVGILGLVVLLFVGAQTFAAATGTGGGFDHGPRTDGPPTPPGGDENPHDPSKRGHG